MLYRKFVRPALFALGKGDAEEAHNIVKRAMRVTQEIPPLLYAIDFMSQAYYNPKPVNVMGIKFPNKVGLAAGFDKNAEVLPFMQALGFGFIEIGSVLPEAQTGDDRPRLFRIPEFDGIINHMGFNSDGAEKVAENLRRVRSRIHIPIGISLGKMKGTPLDRAFLDYCLVLERLCRYGDYFVINVSTPNTPNLRDLQDKTHLAELVREVVDTSNNFGGKPVVVKLAPDMTADKTLEAVEASLENGAAGFIISNTTTERPFVGNFPIKPPHITERGGMSGRWLFHKSVRLVKVVRAAYPDVPIIAVGGINSVEQEVKMLNAGATLIQIYTGLIYEGPDLVRKLRFFE